MCSPLGILATCGIVYDALVGLCQTDLKYVIGAIVLLGFYPRGLLQIAAAAARALS